MFSIFGYRVRIPGFTGVQSLVGGSGEGARGLRGCVVFVICGGWVFHGGWAVGKDPGFSGFLGEGL